MSEVDWERRFHALCAAATEALFVHDGTHVLFANEAGARLLGASSPERIVGRNVFDLVGEADRDRTQALVQARPETASVLTVQRLDGTRFDCEVRGTDIEWDRGVRARMVMARDLGPERAVAEALRASEARFRAMIECSPEGVLVHRNGTVVYANARVADVLGASPDELVGRQLLAMVHPDDLADVIERVRYAAEHGPTRPGPVRFVTPSGAIRTAEVTGTRIEFEGAPANLVLARDITEREQTRAALRASEAKYRALVERLDRVVFQADEAGRLEYASPAWTDVVGDAAEAVSGQPLEAFLHPDDRPGWAAALDRLASGARRCEIACRVERPAGTRQIEIEVVRSEERSGLWGTIADVTERNELESQLATAERMASLGTLAAGIAHEINSPLAAVLANVEVVLEMVRASGGDRDVLDALADAREGTERVRAIVRELRMFARAEQEPRDDQADLAEIVDSAIRMTSSEVRHRARLERDYQPVPRVRGGAGRIAQVVINLLVNAAHATPEGAPAVPVIRVRLATDERGWARIEVEDEGAGMPPEVQRRAFDPFFTTKPSTVGMGMGLAISHRLVSEIGGTIEIAASAPGRGTTMRVSLQPAVTAPDRELRASSWPAAAPGRGSVLVIDDEPAVGAAISRILRPDHEVEVLTSGLDALARVRSGARPDVILCDVMMPAMGGADFVEALAREHPALVPRVVLISGGALDARGRELLEAPGRAWLEKPFSAEALRRAVARHGSAHAGHEAE